jgi:hypothetical protein
MKFGMLAGIVPFSAANHREINLSALSTHFLDHFLGQESHMAHSHETCECFECGFIQTMSHHQRMEQLTVPERIRDRMSDSGANLPAIEGQSLQFVPMEHCLVFARRLFERVGMLAEFSLIRQLEPYASECRLSWTADEFIANWILDISVPPAGNISTAPSPCRVTFLLELRSGLPR